MTPLCFAVLGDPIAHSKSPAMHNAAFLQMGLPHRYHRFLVGPHQLAAALEGARAMGFGGLNLTVPLKIEALEFVDDVSPAAGRIGAVNTVVFEQDRVVGHNTDGLGFLRGVQNILPELPPRAVVLGGGGAARAVVQSLLDAGIEVAWCSRRPTCLPAWDGVTPVGYAELEAHLSGCGILVNATTVGMVGGPTTFPVELELGLLAGTGLVVDLVYGASPERCGSLLERAKSAGLLTQDGHEMLLGQGVRALELWLGRSLHMATVAAMRGALHDPGAAPSV